MINFLISNFMFIYGFFLGAIIFYFVGRQRGKEIGQYKVKFWDERNEP